MAKNCYINSIYRATEGEGIHIGTPQIFVRFQGCKVACLNCDSKETWDFRDESAMDSLNILSEIYAQAGSFPNQLKRVSITGGDPLHPKLVPGVLELSHLLKREGFYVSIEAAGTRIVDEIFDLVDFINIDHKTPSTGVKTNPEIITTLATKFPNKFQVKAVIADEEDFNDTLRAYEYVSNKAEMTFSWCLTPCFEPGESFPQERFQEIIDLNEASGGLFRVIGQQHKWIHGPNKKEI